MATGQVSGLIAGYDPGGNGGHGLALAEIQEGRCTNLSARTLKDSESVISLLDEVSNLRAIGIDTLAAWATGPSGWRAADLWLRRRYKQVQPSIISPNGLYGSMGLNGMAVINSIRQSNPQIHVTETHPKVLFWALTGSKYNYLENSEAMDNRLKEWLDYPIETNNDHEWDAAVSVFAALCGVNGLWSHDLFNEPLGDTGRLVFPSGQAHYWWPD